MEFSIVRDLLPICLTPPRRRSGIKIDKVIFLVAHDTGNVNSTAKGNVQYYKDTYNKESASAHLFVDNIDIIECIPAFQNPEKAWHVLYNIPIDNQVYGCDANDCAIGIELCIFDDKNKSQLAYVKYVWTLAYLCDYYKLNPLKNIISHAKLDPTRRTDPISGLAKSGHTYDQLINDVNSKFTQIQNAKIQEANSIIKQESKPMEKSNEQIMGEIAIDKLVAKGFINTPDKWKSKDLKTETTPLWLLFHLASLIDK